MFAGLTAQKRNAENAAYQQRRSSIEEQGPKQGVLGNLYNKYVSSSPHPDRRKMLVLLDMMDVELMLSQSVFKGPGSPSK